MARKPRFNLPGVPQHIVQRGNNREPCFFAVDDYHRYLRDLHDAARVNNVVVQAYVLMTNHVHLFGYTGRCLRHQLSDAGYRPQVRSLYQSQLPPPYRHLVGGALQGQRG